MTNIHSVGLLWMGDLSVSEDCTCTTHNSHNRQTSMLSAGFEPAIPTSERLQTLALDRGATGTGNVLQLNCYCCCHLHDQIKNYEIGPGGVRMVGIRNVHSVAFMEKREEKKPLRRLELGCEDNIKLDVRIILKWMLKK